MISRLKAFLKKGGINSFVDALFCILACFAYALLFWTLVCVCDLILTVAHSESLLQPLIDIVNAVNTGV